MKLSVFFLSALLASTLVGCSGGFYADHYYDPTPRVGTIYETDIYGRSHYQKYRPYTHRHYGHRYIPPFMRGGGGDGTGLHRYISPNPNSNYVPSEGFWR